MMVIARSVSACFACLAFLAICPLARSVGEEIRPLSRAHAHNDYVHRRPLFDALSNGFCSVEADIYLVDGELLVAHDRNQITPERSLKRLYLDPLRQRVKQNGGRVFCHGPPFTLLIDIKSDAESTFLALHRLLADYDDVFTRVEDGKVISKAVSAIISGNRAKETILAQMPRFAGIDGRLSDLDSKLASHEMPLISDHWGRSFDSAGEGDLSNADAAKLTDTIRRVHQQGRRIRFWATPDSPAAWQQLDDAGVDLINTDKLRELSQFLRGRE